jgi:hypothetical protein
MFSATMNSSMLSVPLLVCDVLPGMNDSEISAREWTRRSRA